MTETDRDRGSLVRIKVDATGVDLSGCNFRSGKNLAFCRLCDLEPRVGGSNPSRPDQ